MKNNFKTTILITTITSLFFIFLICFQYHQMTEEYQYTNNLILSSIITKIKEKYPLIEEKEIIETLNNPNIESKDIYKKYGIDIKNENLSIEQEKIKNKYIISNLITIFTYIAILITIIIIYNKNNKNKINKITNYLKEINNHNYSLDIEENKEGDLSLLKNEIYKTAITLNENAINLQNEKESLKKSLSDISHQLKTPLTSITLMIDTLKNNKSISKKEEKEILNNIHRKIININFLIYNLLKLSRFDADAIEFKKQNYLISEILKEVIDNLSAIIDLKDINIIIKGNKKDFLYCDYKWEVEALTNIIKNCIEHSPLSSKIDITYQKNDIFTKIVIKDYGSGISKKDLPHIFDRFYKSTNSSKDSFGIGLSLAKMIIEKDNGYITVESELKKGTTFIIKYLK